MDERDAKHGQGYAAIVVGDQQHAAAVELLRSSLGQPFVVAVAFGEHAAEVDRVKLAVSVPFNPAAVAAHGITGHEFAARVLRELAAHVLREADTIENEGSPE